MSHEHQSLVDPAVSARVGTKLADKYALTRVLGVGGMGAVYEAQNTWTERRVAIKVMTGARVSDTETVSRFLREARAASRIQHANIVDVLDMGQDPADGTLYIVQEFLVGQDLRRALDERGVFSVREAFDALVPIMSALIAAHEQGVVHRDLKPENIFLTRTAGGVVPKLIDFGIAKVAAPGQGPIAPLTRTGAMMGTPFYMSPEQARGEREIDGQTDVWAMGVVWYEALAGRCPFEGSSYNELLAKILTETAPHLGTLVPTLPPTLASAVQRSLARDRNARYASVREFLAALLACEELQHEDWYRGLRARFDAFAGPLSAPSVATTRGPAVTDGFATTMRHASREINLRSTISTRRSTAWIIAVAAATLGIGTGSYLWERARQPESAAASSAVRPRQTRAAASALPASASSAPTPVVPAPTPVVPAPTPVVPAPASASTTAAPTTSASDESTPSRPRAPVRASHGTTPVRRAPQTILRPRRAYP